MAFAEDSLDKEKNYQWPSSRLTGREMAVLYRIREQTGIPITALLKAAVARFEETCTQELLQTLKNGKTKKPVAKSRPEPEESGHKTYRIAPFNKPSRLRSKLMPESE